MEDRNILNWRSWSTICKAQVIAAAIGASVTFLVTGPLAHSDFGLSRDSATLSFLLQVDFLLLAPAYRLCETFGISQINSWLWVLPLLVNTALSLVLGTFFGWAYTLLRRTRKE